MEFNIYINSTAPTPFLELEPAGVILLPANDPYYTHVLYKPSLRAYLHHLDQTYMQSTHARSYNAVKLYASTCTSAYALFDVTEEL